MPAIVRPFASCCIALALLLSSASAHAQNIFVGPASDPDCDYASVQAAIDAWQTSPSSEFVTLVLSSSLDYSAQALHIQTPLASTGISMRAGTAGCTLTGTPDSITLSGTGAPAGPVIDVEGNVGGDDARFEVTLSGLDIANGHNPAGHGGGLRVRGNVALTVFETRVHDNTALEGGGIAVESTAAGVPRLSIFGNTRATDVRLNSAGFGGGISCRNATLYCDRFCAVRDNTASGNGGGIGQVGCDTQLSPERSSGVAENVGLRNNHADGDGGGAWAQGGIFWMSGRAAARVAPVVGNSASGDGGGLYLDALNADFKGVLFDHNIAGGDGGGVLLQQLTITSFGPSFAAAGCSTDGTCAGFRDNSAGSNGGALRVRSGGTLLLFRDQVFTGNVATRGGVADFSGATGIRAFTNVQMDNNGGSELLLADAGEVNLAYATLTASAPEVTALVRVGGAARVSLVNTIAHDDGNGVVLDAAPGATVNGSCLLVHEGATLAAFAGVRGVVVADPQWDDSARYPANLYVPGRFSPAVDACGFGPGPIPDLLNQPRPQDTPAPDLAGPYDMGAIEFLLPDEVFADGFESVP